MKNATIRLEGTRLRGYDVVVWLPTDFCEAFREGEAPAICGEVLRKCRSCWGQGGEEMRVAGRHFTKLAEARDYYRELCCQINEARAIFYSEEVVETQDIPLE